MRWCPVHNLYTDYFKHFISQLQDYTITSIQMATKSKVKQSSGTDYGQVYEFKDVSYWIYKRRRSPSSPLGKCWHTKIKIKNKKEIRVSTGKETLRTARDKALEIILESLNKLDNGQTIQSRKFELVAEEYLDDLENNPSTIKSKFDKEYRIVKLFLNPYFGKEPADSVNEKVIYEYKKWRKKYWKNHDTQYTYIRNGKIIKSNRNHLQNKKVTASTLHKEDVVLRKILEHARLSGDIPDTKVVKVKSDPVKDNRKPSFTEAEWKKVLKTSNYRSSEDRLWKNKKSRSKKKDYVHETVLNQRILLHEFINFMVGSGLRTSEGMDVKWSDITPNNITEEVNGKFKQVPSVKLFVAKKSKKRKCDPQPYVKEILDRIKKRQFQFAKKNKFKFTGTTESVWLNEYGERVKDFKKSFSKLLEACDLLYDEHGDKRVIGSLRHTYGTFRKNLGEVDNHELAIQMGTSPEMILKHYVHSDDYDRSTAVTRIKKSSKKK